MVAVDFKFYDKNDVVVYTSVTTISNINSGEKFKFKVAIPKDRGVSKTEIVKVSIRK